MKDKLTPEQHVLRGKGTEPVCGMVLNTHDSGMYQVPHAHYFSDKFDLARLAQLFSLQRKVPYHREDSL